MKFLIETVLFIGYIGAGFLYPIYQSLSLVTKQNISKLDKDQTSKDQATKWLVYWIIMGVLSKVLFPFLSVFSGFMGTIVLLVKVLVILGLILPQLDGIGIVQKKLIDNSTETMENFKEQLRGLIKKCCGKCCQGGACEAKSEQKQ